VIVSLQAHHLEKSFQNRPVIRDISFVLHPGEFLVISGGNGAGKTTLLRLLAKLVKPDAGTISIDGQDIWEESDAVRYTLGFLSHQIYLYDDLNAVENLRFTARLFGMEEYHSRITEVLQQLHLYHRQYDPVKTYSRGMQQRLALGRAILHDPDILILDEPFTGLDEAGVEILDTLVRDHQRQNKSAIIVSHNLRAGYDLADTLYILGKGTIAFRGEKTQVSFEEYHSAYRGILESET